MKAGRSHFLADELGRPLSSSERAWSTRIRRQSASAFRQAARDRELARADALADRARDLRASECTIDDSLAELVDELDREELARGGCDHG